MIENTLKLILPSNFLQLQHPRPEYSFLHIEFMIFSNFNIYVSSAANLVHVERALSEKLRKWLRLFFLLVKMDDKGNSKTSIFSSSL